MEGTKRRQLAELRENIQVAVEDVARTSAGASPQDVRAMSARRPQPSEPSIHPHLQSQLAGSWC